MIIALLLILQSFFGITQAYAQIPAPDQPEIAGTEAGQTVTNDVYDIVVPETEPVIEPEQQKPPSLPAPVVQAATTTNSEEAAQASILTKLTLTDATGQVIDAVYNPDSRLDIDDAVHLIYDWELPNNTYKAGDTFTFQLPEQFEIYTDISSPLVTTDGNVTISR